MVGDVLKAASANYYRRCTSGASAPHSPRLLAAARSAPQSNSGVKCNQLSKKAHNFNPSGASSSRFLPEHVALLSGHRRHLVERTSDLILGFDGRTGLVNQEVLKKKSSYFSLPFPL